VALLRAINVGGHIVKMDRLRALFVTMKLTDVATVIASGNVLFTSHARNRAQLERRIETQLHGALGYEVATFIRSPLELAAIVNHHPFPGSEALPEGQALSVVFLKQPLTAPAKKALMALGSATDEFHVHGCEAYWLCRGRISDSKVTGAKLERAVGGPVTARNITTVRKLAEAAAT
jgi:uncharacterized protein (DUF1697 family)